MKVNGMYFQLLDEAPVEGGGGSAAPAEGFGESTSSTPVDGAPAADGKSAGSDVDWVEMSTPDKDDGASDLTPSRAGQDKPAAAPVPPARTLPETPISSAPVVPAQPVQPAATPQQPAVAPQQAVQPQVPENVQPVQPQQPSLADLRSAEIERLTSAYALNDEDARLALVQPEAVFPKLAANLHIQVLESVVNTIMSRVPEVVRAVQNVDTTSRKNEDTFYGSWPALNKPEYKDVVYNAVAAYRQLNPRAPMDEVVRAAGLQAMITLRLPLPQELFQQQNQQPQQGQGFQPAAPAGGGNGGFRPAPANQNPFANLAEEFVEEDRQWR